uniref:hypothetical protein n=1 Tax=Ningiella ruwaisensis TaxID=2364274 RepID=UPI00109EFDC2|nr:hypothetical protein [Ningiella ruwaisensis]
MKLIWFLILCVVPVSQALATNTVRAFACDTCNYSEARQIALQEAPQAESCSEGMPGPGFGFSDPAPSVCDPVEESVIVASTENHQAYKFNLIVTEGVNGVDQVSVYNGSLDSQEHQALFKFFTLIDEIETAVGQASAASFDNVSPPTQFFSSENNSSSNTQSDNWCEANHPTGFFSSASNARDVKSGITNQIKNAMGSRSWRDFTHESYFTGGSIEVGKGSGGIGISLDHYKKALRVTKSFGTGNNLTFDLSVSGELDEGNDKLVFGFKLNPLISKIDGLQVSQLFREGEVSNLAGTSMSNCWNEFVQDEGTQVDPHPSDASGGSGSFADPFYGPGSSSRSGYCIVTYRICVDTSITDLDSGGSGTAPPACPQAVYTTTVAFCG